MLRIFLYEQFKRLPYILARLLKRYLLGSLPHEDDLAKLVLITEDTSLIRALTEGLEFKNLNSTYLREPKELLEFLLTYEPDLLIYDYSPKEEKAFSLLKQIRELKPHLPIILLSSEKDFLQEAEIMHLDLAMQIFKPFDMYLLIETMNKLFVEVEKVKEGSSKGV